MNFEYQQKDKLTAKMFTFYKILIALPSTQIFRVMLFDFICRYVSMNVCVISRFVYTKS